MEMKEAGQEKGLAVGQPFYFIIGKSGVRQTWNQ
jgi:hypothetical protein